MFTLLENIFTLNFCLVVFENFDQCLVRFDYGDKFDGIAVKIALAPIVDSFKSRLDLHLKTINRNIQIY